MGLDQYGWSTTKTVERDADMWPHVHVPEDMNWHGDGSGYYFRKHSKLQEFFEAKWREEGLMQDDINCKHMPIPREWIEELRQLTEDDALPRSPGGFFYGHQWQDGNADDMREHTLDFCEWALTEINEGKNIYWSTSF